jgi:hypothetical protein
MNYKDLKHEIGNLTDKCTYENFLKGYDPICIVIDEYESNNDIPSDLLDKIEENAPWELTESFLDSMDDVKKGDENYSKIYLIDFYCNGFYYSKEVDDLFREELRQSNGKNLNSGKARRWYYYFINRRIMEKYEIDSSILDNVESKFLFETNYNLEWRILFPNEN